MEPVPFAGTADVQLFLVCGLRIGPPNCTYLLCRLSHLLDRVKSFLLSRGLLLEYAGVLATMNFGATLRRERIRAGLSQQALADKCEVSAVYIYRLEKNGIDPPARRMCRAVTRALGIDIEVLWRPAFTSRLRRWLAKEGYGAISENTAGKLLEVLEGDRRSRRFQSE